MALQRPPLPEVFGNYSIRGIEEVLPAEPVTWWPSTLGWQLLLALLVLILAWRGWRLAVSWRRNRYRRAALAELQALQSCQTDNAHRLASLAALLKATAVYIYPRPEVAALSGHNWLTWLNGQTATALFSERSAQLLGEAVYRAEPVIEGAALQQLAVEIEDWIRSHPEPGDA